jgi:transposase
MPRNELGLVFTPPNAQKVIPMRNRAYRATPVKQVNVSVVVNRLAAGAIAVGVDVGKEHAFCVVRDSQAHFERPWKVNTPSEVRELVGLLRQLAGHRALVVAMESTGTYGDALRQALTDAGLAVRRVSGKAASDYAEIFDGVPSAHDGKDAAVVAELAAQGKSSPWPMRQLSTREAELQVEVCWMDTQQSVLQSWLGRLEGLLSRHWPEATRLLKLSSGTLLRVLAGHGSPAALAADGEAAAKLSRWSGQLLKPEKIQALLESARQTIGVRMDEPTVELVRRSARAALTAQAEIRGAKRRLAAWVKEDPLLQAQAEVVGTATACVLRVAVGDPRDYHCGQAYRKAMGLNLKERSSGKHRGKLKITKRGSSLARRWLYFAAMRTVQQAPIRAWYQAKRAKDKDRGTGALVAVMRKLALALYAVTVYEECFELERLLPGKSQPRRRRKREASSC